jgi:uncharacterized protein YndB with AHSA1/START domain
MSTDVLTTSTHSPAPATTPLTVALALRATPEQVWHALTDAAVTPAYYYGFAAELPRTAGSSYRYTAGGGDMITGRVVEADDTRIRMTFNGFWQPDVAALPESVVTISLDEPAMPTPGVTVLTLVHDGLPDSPAAQGLHAGWVLILSGLKTLLETGTPLAAAPTA